MVADTFHIANQIDEYRIVFRATLPLAKTGDMLCHQIAAHCVDFIFQRV
jgi:hypothetical protein